MDPNATPGGSGTQPQGGNPPTNDTPNNPQGGNSGNNSNNQQFLDDDAIELSKAQLLERNREKNRENATKTAQVQDLTTKINDLTNKINQYEQEKKDSETKRLQDQGNWESIAKNLESENATLKTKVAEYDQLVPLLNDQIDTEIKDWEKEAKDLVPAKDKASLPDRLQWVSKARAVQQRIRGTGTGANAQRGNRPNPQRGDRDPEEPKRNLRQDKIYSSL
jgi:chromosome segregation ATPase